MCLSDKTLSQHLARTTDDLEGDCQQLVAAALEAGSLDNISCQILHINTLPTQDPDEVFSQLTALPFPPELEEGMVLDGYRITQELHASSTSQLYLAVDEESQQRVVIKTPSINFEDDPAYLERFQLEEWVGRRIDSPHVIRTIEQTRPRRFLYYVMEYIEGKTLEQWMHDQDKPDLTVIRNIVSQVVSGLRAFHRLEMLHQDLKPGNIMITPEGLVKIVDFGSTKIAGIADVSTPVERKVLLGTKDYTAPEYLMEQAGTTQSDLFSLGCIIYQMLTGHLPYGEGLLKYVEKGTMNKLRFIPVHHYTRAIPDWVDKAVQKAVEIQPEKRYSKLSELETDLRKPNPAYLKEESLPLMERNPLGFWKGMALIMLVVNLVLGYLLLS